MSKVPRNKVTIPYSSSFIHTRSVGINIAGFITAESGLGTAVRNTVFALKAQNIPYALSNVTCTDSRQDDFTLRGEILNEAPYNISLLHVNPDHAKKALRMLPKDFFPNKHRIGYWTWESDVVPRSWIRFARNFHEVWTPSTFAQEILSSALSIPVHRIPHPVVVDAVEGVTREELRLPEGFLFLCMFDYFSSFERKNPLGTIEAFKQAFGDGQDASLVIKCINGHLFPREHRTLLDACRQENITVLDTYLSSGKTRGLIKLCDAFVSLHRSEGFGLPLAEALAFGKPVIATHFGGSTDFLSEENSMPVRCTVQKTKKKYGAYPKGSHWAEPDVHHAAEHMQRALKQEVDPHLPSEYSVQEIGQVIQKHLERLSS